MRVFVLLLRLYYEVLAKEDKQVQPYAHVNSYELVFEIEKKLSLILFLRVRIDLDFFLLQVPNSFATKKVR